VEHGLDSFISETERGSAMSSDHSRALEGVKAVFSDRAVVADSLDVK
jgi:hypothetical protein